MLSMWSDLNMLSMDKCVDHVEYVESRWTVDMVDCRHGGSACSHCPQHVL